MLLNQAAVIRQVSWWGFYGMVGQGDEPPDGPEIMRVRFYAARPGDGLPDDDNILYEESFLNPSRTATGEVIGVDDLPAEYLYEVELRNAVGLEAETLYWLEIVQVGDIESLFRWESGYGKHDGHAFINPSFPDWRYEGSSLAFQLSTIPEPGSIFLCLAGLTVLVGRVAGDRVVKERKT